MSLTDAVIASTVIAFVLSPEAMYAFIVIATFVLLGAFVVCALVAFLHILIGASDET